MGAANCVIKLGAQGWDTLASSRFACAAGSVAVEHVGANTAIRSKDQRGPDERTIKLQTTCLKAQAGGFFLYYRMDMNHSTVLGS